jgi:hypothetical protein
VAREDREGRAVAAGVMPVSMSVIPAQAGISR